jgi:hypothetical protein
MSIFVLYEFCQFVSNKQNRCQAGKYYTMPRLSLWKNEKTSDFHFMDRVIREQFLVGGTAVLVHKYLQPADQGASNDPTKPNHRVDDILNETKIQDLLFLENRDRIYDPDVYELRGVYSVGDQDFDLTQFGLFLSADTIFITFHTNDMVERMGRKLIAGDVIELPHVRDDLLLDQSKPAINKFYVIQDAARAAEGFSQTWYPHIWRIKASPMTDAQEYRDILQNKADNGVDTLKDALSTYQKELEISKAIVERGEQLAPTILDDGDNILQDTSKKYQDKSSDVYDHGETLNQGLSFPLNPAQGDFFLRTDYNPPVLFAYRGTRWQRMDVQTGPVDLRDRNLNAAPFINNNSTTVVGGKEMPERQALSQVIKPKVDH